MRDRVYYAYTLSECIECVFALIEPLNILTFELLF